VSIQILPYRDEHVPAVKAFNQRLTAGRAGFTFPESPNSEDLPANKGVAIYQNLFVAVEDTTSQVHGGYILKHQPIRRLSSDSASECEEHIGNYQLPLSEGIVDAKYGMVGIRLYLDAMSRQKKLYSLGMGNLLRPLPQLLKKMGWTVAEIPFFFKVLHPGKVIRRMPAIRQYPPVKRLLPLLDQGKIFPLLIHLYNAVQRMRRPVLSKEWQVFVEPTFGPWADDLWRQTASDYQWIAKRDSNVLNLLYPGNSTRYCRLRIQYKNETIGWILVLDTRMHEHKQFPFLKVGTIADGLTLKGREMECLLCAEKHLLSCDVDLIISNQSHDRWTSSLRRMGYMRGPSNYIAAFSPDLWQGLERYGQCHINRGDGDGPIHL
jgi:hypothetical protein